MKKIILTIVGSLTFYAVQSQQLFDVSTLTLADSIDYSRQTSNKNLMQYSLTYAPLSQASPPYMDLGNPKDSYILSADIQPQFVIGGEWLPFTVHLTPRFKARIFHDNVETDDNSLPVRTPSFMPGATVYLPLQSYARDPKTVRYASVAVFHHSNGQDGNEFDDDGMVNLYNGNFSTNYVEPAFHFRLRQSARLTPNNCFDAIPNYQDWYFKLGVEKHFITAENLKSTYGDYRVNLSVSWIDVRSYCDLIGGRQVSESYYREKHCIVFNSTVIAGGREGDLGKIDKRLNMGVAYNWRIPSSPNTALFVGTGYYGSDPYNIYYQQSYFYANAGIALGFFVAPGRTGLK